MLRLFPKDVEVYIVGTGNYSGRVKIGTFAINAAVIEAADITVPEKFSTMEVFRPHLTTWMEKLLLKQALQERKRCSGRCI